MDFERRRFEQPKLGGIEAGEDGSRQKEKLLETQERKELSKEELEVLRETWTSVVGGKEFNADGLNKEELKKALYESLKPAIEETIDALGIKMPDPELVQRMREARNDDEKVGIQKEIIDGVSRQIKEIPFAKWSFFPKEIQETKEMNCSGCALLTGYILNQSEIKTFYGQPVGHALNVAELADGSLVYIDSRNRSESVRIPNDKMKIEDHNGIRVLKIEIPEIEYKIIPLSPEEGATSVVIGSFEALKNEPQNIKATEEEKQQAAKIYSRFQHLLDGTDFGKFEEKLDPELINYLKSEEFKKEEVRVGGLRDFSGKLKEIAKDLSEVESREIAKELKDKLFLVKEMVLGDEAAAEKAREQLSDKTDEYLRKLREAIEPLKNWNYEEAENAIEKGVIDPIRNYNYRE